MPEYDLTTAALDFTGYSFVRLRFWRWLNVERPAYDHAFIRVSRDGIAWPVVWANTEEITDSSWTFMEIDISALADEHQVYVRWAMGPTDSSRRYSGWNIDDVEFAGLAPGGGTRDCNHNSVPDECDIASGTSQDCNANGVPDECDIANGTSQDANGDGVWARASDYSLYLDEKGRFHVMPYDANETFSTGGGPGGPGASGRGYSWRRKSS
jgi:hypothetical protein